MQKSKTANTKKTPKQKKAGVQSHISTRGMQRLLLIDREISKGKYPSVSYLSDLIDQKGLSRGTYHRSTFFRDIETLKLEFNAPIEFDSYNKGYYYTEKTFRIPAMMTTDDQIKAARVVRNLLDTVKGSPLYDDAQDVFETLSQVAPQTDSAGNIHKESLIDGEIDDHIIFLMKPAVNFSRDVWDVLAKAIEEKCHVVFNYASSWHEKKLRYTVQPYQLIFDDGNWCLWGLDAKKKARRLFVLPEISDIELHKEKFKLPKDYDFRKLTHGTFGCFVRDKYETYKIKLTGYIARRAPLRVWGKNQQLTENDDGSITLVFESNQDVPILTWILGWGADAVPLAPAKLVKDWKKKVDAMYERKEEIG